MKTFLRKSQSYSRVDAEDPEEKIHRRAQFLIYKALEQADTRRKPSHLRIRIRKLKVKVGKRLKKMRRSMSISISVIKFAFHRRIISQLAFMIRRALISSSQKNGIDSLLPPP